MNDSILSRLPRVWPRSRPRQIALLVALLLTLAVLWVGWTLWQAQRDLSAAKQSIDEMSAAVDAGDETARAAALADFQEAAHSARDRTHGPTWSLLNHAPVFGDDARAVKALSASLDTIASGGIEPLLSAADELHDVTGGDARVDLTAVEGLQEPLAASHAQFAKALEQLEAAPPTDGLVGPLRSRFVNYAKTVQDLAEASGAAETAAKVLPTMLGGDGPRDYLLLFENNAEIRATGGQPGSWARIHADDGLLTMEEQGTAADFPVYPEEEPIGNLSEAEIAVYGPEIGRYFQDPGFTPDFPRAAEIFNAFWADKHPEIPLDGVVAVDPVALSYLMEGTGPVVAQGYQLTADNVVESLLSIVYDSLDPARQDAFFQEAAQAIFSALTTDLQSPTAFARGLARAGAEGRFLVAAFDPEVAAELRGSRVEGAIAPDDEGTSPHVYVGLNDATGAKMSYFLRFKASAKVKSCFNDVQVLDGTLSLHQTISAAKAATLDRWITGGGDYATEPGRQLVMVRLYGPVGGSIEDLRINSEEFEIPDPVMLDGRPVLTALMDVHNRKNDVLTWTMKTAPGQTGDIHVGVTPSVVPGDGNKIIRSGC